MANSDKPPDRSSPFAIALGPNEITDDVTAFLALVGEAIARWSHVETQVGELYCFVVGAHGVRTNLFHQSIVVSYYTILGFEARLAMTSAAVLETVERFQTLKQGWTTLNNRISRKYRIRSNIAHCSLYGHCKHRPGTQIWLQPTPPIFGVKRGREGRPIQYFASDLRVICDGISVLAREIDLYSNSIFSEMVPLAKRRPKSP